MSDSNLKQKRSVGSLIGGLLLLAAGIVLLVLNITQISLPALPIVPWPLFIIGPGLLLLWPAFTISPETDAGQTTIILAIIGSVLVVLGTMLGLMSLFNYFQSWAYAWTLLIAAGTSGYLYALRFSSSSHTKERGRSLLKIALLAFILFAGFFELLIFGGNWQWWPVGLIVLGLYFLLRRNY